MKNRKNPMVQGMHGKGQGGCGIAKQDPGSFFFEVTSGHGLTRYVSGRLSIYGNAILYMYNKISLLSLKDIKTCACSRCP